MRKIRTLHLASFNGNIGDNANHNGFYNGLSEIKEYEFSIDKLEIREFYWRKRFFDESFVSLVNQYDLLIIGGGNYFELWVENSPTGTSVMIAPDMFKKINIPVVFNALGVDPAQGASKRCCDKFRKFLDVVFENPKNLVSLRNDGSFHAMEHYIGRNYADNCLLTPDAGCNLSINKGIDLHIDGRYIALNVAGDMLDKRFSECGDEIGYDSFLSEISIFLQKIILEKIVDHVVFVPHVFKDLECASDIISLLSDDVRRKNVVLAPLLTGQGCEEIFSLYEKSIITIAMRFHANLCSISQNVPTIGLINYRQIEELYKGMNLSDYVVDVRYKGFSMELLKKVKLLMESGREEFEFVSAFNKNEYKSYLLEFKCFLDRCFE